MKVNLKKNELILLCGSNNLEISSDVPFSENSIFFLSELSNLIFKKKNLKNFPEIISFAFWCRKENLIKMKNQYLDSQEFSIGRGLVFHLPPSNVPINFAYSFSLGLLTGNSNVIKMPSKKFLITNYLTNLISELFSKKKFINIKKRNSFIAYDSNDIFLTEYISKFSNIRMIWGGDKKVSEIQSIKSNVFTLDIPFYDKYSFSLINLESLKNFNNIDYINLAEKFFRDAFFMDQNACGSPHLIIWIDKNNKYHKIKNKFWNSLCKIVQEKYNSEEIFAIDKYSKFTEEILNNNDIKNIHSLNNIIYICTMKSLPKNKLTTLRGKYGYFYEYNVKNINEIKKFINNKFQTMSYYGLDEKQLKGFALKNKSGGIDRIVPIGKSHNLGFKWDGYDLFSFLTRKIDIQKN